MMFTTYPSSPCATVFRRTMHNSMCMEVLSDPHSRAWCLILSALFLHLMLSYSYSLPSGGPALSQIASARAQISAAPARAVRLRQDVLLLHTNVMRCRLTHFAHIRTRPRAI